MIYEVLRSRIIHLELAPESVLNLSELAEEFKVSRTPIKEVLLTLQAEDWLLRQGSHFIVTPLSLERIREITEIRMVLEVQANTWAMQRINPQELKELEQIKERILVFDASLGNKAIVDFDSTIHHLIFKAARNIQLTTMLERILSHYLRFWLAVPRHIEARVFFSEALQLIDAIVAKDEKGVRECTLNHIRNSVAEIMGTR
jgi:DNA-binding GntR family transcriptional regulator